MATTQPGTIDVVTNLFIVDNRIATTLDGAHDDSTLTLNVTDGSVFPTPGRFKITIDNEVIDCASVAGNVITAEARGVEGSSAAAHSDLVAVAMQFTKGHYETLRDAIIATQEGYMQRPTANDTATGASRPAQSVFADPFEQTRRFAL